MSQRGPIYPSREAFVTRVSGAESTTTDEAAATALDPVRVIDDLCSVAARAPEARIPITRQRPTAAIPVTRQGPAMAAPRDAHGAVQGRATSWAPLALGFMLAFVLGVGVGGGVVTAALWLAGALS